MKLVVTDSSYRNQGFIKRFKLDMEFGLGDKGEDSDFLLTVPCRMKIPTGSLIYIPGTEWGGIIKEPWAMQDKESIYRCYHGLTWHGLMDERVLYPDSGIDHLVVSGDASEIIQTLIERVGLQDLFQAAPSTGLVISSWQFDHDSTYFYSGLMKMLESVGYILDIKRNSTGKTLIGAIPKPVHTEDSRASHMGFTAKKLRPINHLICLGKGELKDRIRVDLYADKSGDISQTQTIFGVNIREEIYDLGSAELDELIEQGTKYLKDKQELTYLEMSLPEGIYYPIGSEVNRKVKQMGLEMSGKVNGMVVRLFSNGDPEISATLSEGKFVWDEEEIWQSIA